MRQTDRQIDRQTDRQIDRQTEREEEGYKMSSLPISDLKAVSNEY